ncbi:MAG: DUF1559 domain-containing protein, partial [Planctomycetota bacterium]
VVIAIIGTLVALLLPAVQRAREAGRRATCLNNIKQIALGMFNYETNKQEYPGYVQSFKRDATNPQQYLQVEIDSVSLISGFVSTENISDSRISWVAKMLPQLEQNAIHDAMVDSTTGGQAAVIPQIEILLCPSDFRLADVPGNAGMTYVANTGNWDWFGTVSTPFNQAQYDGDVKANGVFHNRLFGDVKMSMSAVSNGDGASNTIMLSENVHKPTTADGFPLYTWAGVDFEAAGEQPLGMVWLEDEENQNRQAGLSDDAGATAFTSAEPTFARPASTHDTGVFNTAFCDGSAKSLSPEIDYDVYQRLMTVEGRKCIDTDTDMQSIYRNLAPLSSSDL